MRSPKLKWLTILLFWNPLALANEGGGEKAVEVPRDQREFAEKKVKLGALAGKLEEAEKQFAELVHEKREAPTAEAKFPYLKEMVEVAKKRNADVVDYNKLKTELTLRYPNRGEHLNQHYRPREEHTAEELEHELGSGPSLDELLVETKRMIDRKYGPLDPANAAKTRAPASLPSAGPKAPRLRLER